MPIVPISVSGGRVNSKDRSLLQPGELTVAENCEYHVNDPAIHQIPGRTVFNSTAEGSGISGIAYAEFDTIDDRVVIASGTELKSATAGSTGTFSSTPELQGLSTTLSTTVITGATQIDTVHYNDKYYIMDGTNGPYQVGSQAESSAAGGSTLYSSLNIKMSAPAALTYADTGSGPGGFVLSSGSTIDVWYVEYFLDSDGEIILRSPPSPRTTITGDGTKIWPQLTFPSTITNIQANTVQMYATSTNLAYPVGVAIGGTYNAGNGATVDMSVEEVTDPAESDYIASGLSPNGTSHPVLTVLSDGVTGNFTSWGEVPQATTGDIFEDSLVLNDTSNGSIIRYSFPDSPTEFPESNFIRFETKQQDTVKCIRTMGNSMIVGLSSSIWRVALLPRPEDATFDRGRVRSIISSSHGIVGPQAATTFGFGARSGDSAELLAFVSKAGVMTTNGYSWDVLTDDVDWENEVNLSLLSQCVLVNNPRQFRLELYYTPNGATTNTKAMYLHYHPSHTKSSVSTVDSRVKVTWPVNAIATDATGAIISGRHEVFTCHPDGKVYLESSGNTDTSASGGNAMSVQTSLYHGGGIGGQSEVERVGVQHKAYSGQTGSVGMIIHNTGADDYTAANDSVSLTRNETTYSALVGAGDAHQFKFSATGGQSPVSLNYFVIKGTQKGESREP